MILLPELEAVEFKKKVINIERDFNMPYINTIESLARKEGFEEAEKHFQQEQLEKTKSIARGMFSVAGLDDKKIAEITGLAIKDVTQLRLGSKH